jgi:hypothetical protein
MSYARLLEALRCPDAAVRAAWRVGSRVYGTARPDSDEDFAVILEGPAPGRDVVFGNRLNVVTQSVAAFEEALTENRVFALECLFAPPVHTLKAPLRPFTFGLQLGRLLDSAREKSDSDFAKAEKRFALDRRLAKKKLFHALRVPAFALEVAQTGKLTRFEALAPLWLELWSDPSPSWTDHRERYGRIRERTLAELSALSRGRRR